MSTSLKSEFLKAMEIVERRHDGNRTAAARWFGVSKQRWGQWILGKHTPDKIVMERLIEASQNR